MDRTAEIEYLQSVKEKEVEVTLTDDSCVRGTMDGCDEVCVIIKDPNGWRTLIYKYSIAKIEAN